MTKTSPVIGALKTPPRAPAKHKVTLLEAEETSEVRPHGCTRHYDRALSPYRSPEANGQGTGYDGAPGVVRLDTALTLGDGAEHLRHPMADIVPHDVADEEQGEEDPQCGEE